jgi:hypothetical protein
MNRKPKPVLPPTRHRKRWLAVLLSGASNIGIITPWLIAGGPAGDVHVMFSQMQKIGWLITHTEPDPGLQPPRKFFGLTPEGRSEVMKLLHLEEG